MDTRTGELLALADYPTFDANDDVPVDQTSDLGSRGARATSTSPARWRRC